MSRARAHRLALALFAAATLAATARAGSGTTDVERPKSNADFRAELLKGFRKSEGT